MPGVRRCRAFVPSTRRLWKCKESKKQYSVKVATIFEDSAPGLDELLPAVHKAATGRRLTYAEPTGKS